MSVDRAPEDGKRVPEIEDRTELGQERGTMSDSEETLRWSQKIGQVFKVYSAG